MNSQPVKSYRKPIYPTRLEVLKDHALLEKHMPPAWKSCAEMAGVVTLLLATNNCAGFPPEAIRAAKGKPAVVAPIFAHGEGRGATGCVVVNPPIFLSEQDAMQVIREELRKSGVDLSQTNAPLKDVKVTHREMTRTHFVNEVKPLNLQALDPKKKVGVEYVSEGNYFALGGEPSSSSVQDWDVKEVALGLGKRVQQHGHDIYFGVFYDPVGYPKSFFRDPAFSKKRDALYSELEKAPDSVAKAVKEKEIEMFYDQALAPVRAKSRELLKEQVKDFIDWLKGQGVI